MALSDAQRSAHYVDVTLPPEELVERLAAISAVLVEMKAGATPEQRGAMAHLCKDTVKALDSEHEEVSVLSLSACMDLLRIFAPVAPFPASSQEAVFTALRKLAPVLRKPEAARAVAYCYALKCAAEMCAVALICKGEKSGGTVGALVESLLSNVTSASGSEVFRSIEALVVTAIEELVSLPRKALYPLLVSLTPYNRDLPRYTIARKALSRLSCRAVTAIDELMGCAFESPKGLKCEELRSSERYGITYYLYKIQKEFVLRVLTLLPGEFESREKTKVRKALELVGRLAACRGSSVAQVQVYLFQKFLERFDAQEKEIRILMLELALKFFKHWNPGTEQVLSAVATRISDAHEKVRILAIQNLSQASKSHILSPDLLSCLCDRLRDKCEDVRREARCTLCHLYTAQSLEVSLRGGEVPGALDIVGNALISSYSSVQKRDDQIHLIQCLDGAIAGERTVQDAAKSLYFLYRDLTLEGRRDFSHILSSKKYWMGKICEVMELKAEDWEAQEPLFSAQLMQPLSVAQMRQGLEEKHCPIVHSLMRDREMYQLWKTLADEKCHFSDKLIAREALKDLARQKDTLTLKAVEDLLARVATFWVSYDQVPILYSLEPGSLPLLSACVHVFPTFLTPIQSNLVALLSPTALPELWALLRAAGKMKKLTNDDLATVRSVVPTVLQVMHEPTMREIGIFAGENFPDDYVRIEILGKVIPQLSTAVPLQLLSHLVLIRELMRTLPDAFDGLHSTLIPFLSTELLVLKTVDSEKSDTETVVGKCKVEGIAILALFARGQKGFSAAINEKRVFCTLFKVVFRLGKYIRKVDNSGEMKSISQCFSKIEEEKVRAKALGELLSLFVLKEIRPLLTLRRLVALSLLLLTGEKTLSGKMARFLTEDSDARSRILPYAAALLSILAATSSKKDTVVRSALQDVMKELSGLSTASSSPGLEVYIVYLIAICASHKIYADPQFTKRCLSEYISAIPTDLNSVYLLSLCHLLPRFELKDKKPVVTDLPLVFAKEPEVLKVSEIADLLSELVRAKSPEDAAERRERKVIIPGHLFYLREQTDSALKYIQSSAASKRSRETDAQLPVKRLSLQSSDR